MKALKYIVTKFFKSYLFLFFILLPISTFAIDLEHRFANTLVSTMSYIENNPDQVWPGFHIKNTPSIIYFLNSDHTFAFNYSPKSELWQKIIFHKEPVYFLEGDKFGLGTIDMAYGIKVEDQPSYIIQMGDPIYVIESAMYFVNHRFHFYLEKESKFKTPFSDYDAFTNLENVKLSFLETSALKMYLESFDEEAQNALKDAIAIHRYRTSLLSEKARQYEEAMEIQRGLPSFVSIQSQNFNNVDFVQKVEYQLGLDPLSICSGDCVFPLIARWMGEGRFNFTSPAYGKFLDTLPAAKNWREKAETSSKSIERLVQEYQPMSLEEAKLRTEEAKNNSYYRYPKIEKNIDDISLSYLQESSQLQENYKNSPGIEVNIEFPPTMSNIYYDYIKIYQLSVFKTLLTTVTSILKSSDGKTRIKFDNFPILLVQNPKLTSFPKELYRENNFLKFKLEPETKLFIDGKENSLGNFVQEKNSIPFHSLEFKTEKIKVHVEQEGVLEIKEGTVFFKLIDSNE